MKTDLLIALAVSLLLVSTAFGQSQQELILEKGVAPHAGIDDVYRRFSEAYNKFDFEAVTNLYTEDAFYLSPGSDIKRGREKILAEFSGYFNSVKNAGGTLAVSFQILDRRVSGDLAYDVGIYTVTEKAKNGEARAGRGKFVVVARRMSSGEWRFQVDAYNGLPKPQNNSTQTSELNPKDLETLLEPIFSERMEKLHIPGAAIAIVKDGKILFTKGYGVADVEKKTPVIPDKTIFRIGSITKVFTATAVMQLADGGRISLSDDVNKYLKSVQAPNTFPQPITFADLLTHTSGLDEISPGRRTGDHAQVIPLGAFLKTRIVRRAPPGEIISYSTYNPALAAHTIEQITQKPFKIFLRENIFEPLQMTRTSIAEIPENLQSDLATGYEYAENKHQKLPFQWFHTYPASDINSTATDMARFMIANLQYGTIDGKRILSEKSAREMQATHFRNHPRIPGWAYGFYETEQNNLRFVEHGGSMDDGYSALLSLIPEKNTGLFIACNTESCAFGLSGAIKNAFLNRYFPSKTKPEVPQTKNPSPDALRKFAGKYQSIIYCHSCAPNTSYVPEAFEVKVTDDGMLSFLGGRWKQIEPMLFVLADGERAGQIFTGFKENAKGEIAYMFQDTYMVYEKNLR
ncbi:MAG TPA: serine hydrolase [Pyrinomonadaceae bacterium]